MKKLNTVLIIALVLSVAVIAGLLIGDQFGKYSQHKWYEGHAEDIIFDVMDNYAYPGTSAADVEASLGVGKDDAELKEKILTMFGYQNDENDAYAVWIYPIEANRYFVVVHDREVVVKTMLVDSLT